MCAISIKEILSRKLLLLFVLALCACDSRELTRIPPGGVILAFGDSLTVGVGAVPDMSYPNILAGLSGLTVVGAGVSGETTVEGLNRIAGVLEEAKPDLLILLEGGNDIIQNISHSEIKSNLGQMIELAQERGVEVVLIGVPEKRLFSKVAPLYRELAEEYGVILEEHLMGDLLREPEYKSDQIHLNDKGYRVMAESIYATLQEYGAI